MLVSGTATLAVIAVPALHIAYRSATLHAALETAASLIAILAAFLIVGRVRRSTRLDELLLASGLSVLALSSVLFVLVATLSAASPQGRLYWDARIDSTLGPLLLGAAAFSPHRQLRQPRRASAMAAVGVLVAIAATAACTAVLGPPSGPSGGAVATGGSWPDLHAPVAVLVLHGIAAAAYLAASVGFLRRAERRGDAFFGWLSVALAFAVFSRLNYIVLPSRFTDWVYSGEAFRLLFYVLLLLGTLWEIRYYWKSLTRAAILEERRRIARDLHDGLAQEIAYIDRNLHSLGPLDGERGDRLQRLRRAVERAQRESRTTFAALASPVEEPLDVVLERATTEIANRFGAELELDLSPGVQIEGARAESLLRIACEAVANAARHSGSDRIVLMMDRAGSGLRLQVRDAGRGFDPAAPTGGFGLISMHERARAIGGKLRIESERDRGTTVELSL